MRILGYTWKNFDGFTGLPFEEDFPTNQAAYGRVQRAKNTLNQAEDIEGWYVRGEVTRNADGTWHLKGEVLEIC